MSRERVDPQQLKFSTDLQIVLVLMPTLVFYALLLRFYTAIPMIDDYWFMMAFVLDWIHSSGAMVHASMVLMTQVGPYRMIFNHAVLGLQLATVGRLNFPAMIFLGNLLPLGTFVLLCKNTPLDRSRRDWLLPLLPVSLLLFSMNYAELLDWAIASLQNLGGVFFTLAALHFLVKAPGRTRSFAAACVCGLMASAANATGLMVWPVGVLYLLTRPTRAKRWGSLAVWTGVLLAVALLFARGSAQSGIGLHGSVWRQALFFISFCGGGLENMHHRPVPYVSLVIGAGVLFTVVCALKTRYDRANPFFFYTMVWVLSAAALAANGRTSMGFEVSLSSRYKVFCDLLLIFCYEYWLHRVRLNPAAYAGPVAGSREAKWLMPAIAAALIFCFGADYAGSMFLRTRKQRAEGAMRAYLADPASSSPMFLVEDHLSPDEVQTEDLARRQLNELIQAGVYTPPKPGSFGF